MSESKQPKVLVVTDRVDPQLEMLRAVPHALALDDREVADGARDATVILHWSGTRDRLRAAFLACGQVQWVHSRWAGVDSLLFPELVESDVIFTNGSGVFSQSLGEFALAAILYFAKDFPRVLRNQRAARWEPFDVDEIDRQTVGIIGYGDIGRAVARRVRAMGMQVLALKRHVPEAPDPLVEEFYPPDAMNEMLARCDYVVVTAPLTKETRHMVSEEEFAAMKASAVIINVGRGPVIDQAAMGQALRAGKIRGAGLDVFEEEPLAAGDPLWSMENVLVSPHTADHTRTWIDDAMRYFLRQYARFAQGEPLDNVVNKRLGY
ncbi:MAG TPA: D-2-hydroxyacid dehydrogenase [Acidobacteriaceae bacterium]|jgi:phosphoglycerate dehydrogenase-like enzyme|nr:D-2-hydroxyacid dehydrogenase [Acidobacteriaceae bacterium]